MRNLIIVALLFFPCYAYANKAVVRSGEHAGFSRITIQLSQPIPWSVGKVDNGYEVRLEQSLTDINISEVYKRIPRDRISELLISKDKKHITLKTGCDCFADAFEFRPGFLVIDIKDGQATEGSVFEKTFASDEILSKHDATIQDNKPMASQIVKLPIVISKPEFTDQSQTQFPTQRALPDINLPHAALSSEDPLNQMQSIMLKQVSRAASQGLLQANVPFPLAIDPQDRTELPHVTKELDAISNHQNPPNDQINMHIQSSIDSAIEKSSAQHSLTAGGDKCLENRIFDISTWGNSASVLSEVSKQSALAVGEFDKVNEQAVEALVKAYLYAGFGAESENALVDFGISIEHSDILRAMARIIDGNLQQNNANLFIEQFDCGTNAALWATLAQNHIPKTTKVNTSSVLMAFAKLPAHLRLHLGPDLSQSFLESGDIETAQALSDSISRTPGLEQPTFLLLSAKLDHNRGHESSASRTLKQIISEDSEISPAALNELLKAQLKNSVAADSYLISTAETYIFEHQGTKTGADLLHVLILSTAKSGNLTKTLELLDEAQHSTHFSSEQKNKLWEGVLEFALAQSTDEELMHFIISTKNVISERHLSRDVHRKLAKRLLKNGFPELAQKILNTSNPPTLKDRLILAEIALSTHVPTQSIAILEGLTTDEAIALRARAYSLNNDHFEASLEYDKLSDANQSQREIWRAGSWEKLNADASKASRTAIEIMIPVESKPVSIQSGTIRKGKALVNNSKAMRTNLENLMRKYSSPDQNGS